MTDNIFNVLFLDFDGVLNRYGHLKSCGLLSKNCISKLNTIVEQTEKLRIVISSCWRMGRSVEVLRHILKNGGFKYSNFIIDTTLFGVELSTRGDEIKEWLSRNNRVNKFVIIDDNSDMAPYMDRLVQTNGKMGITDNDVNEVVNLFK